MRTALNLRYALVPYHYSLAHAAFGPGGLPIMRPLLLHYEDDATASALTSQWLDGEKLLVAPVLAQDNTTSAYLPGGSGATWFEFNSTTTHQGGTTLQLSGVPLAHVPVYARVVSR